MNILSKLRTSIETTKLARKYTANSYEILFNILKEKLTKSDRQKKSIKIIMKDGEKYVIPSAFGIYNLLKLLSYGWTLKGTTDKMQMYNPEKNIYINLSRNASIDLLHLIEIFEEKAYGEEFHGIVIDVGAYIAESSIYFASQGAERVIALEPYPEYFELAQENIKINHLENKITLLPYALAEESGEMEFYVSTNNPNANTLRPTEYIKSFNPFDRKIKVKTITLQELFTELNISRVYLLKLDCEGCEYSVLPYLPDNLYQRIENIILEFHDGPKNLPNILKSKGFQVTYSHTEKIGILRATENKTGNQRTPDIDPLKNPSQTGQTKT